MEGMEMDGFRRFTSIALVVALLVCPFLFARDRAAQQQAVVKSFREYIEHFIQSYTTDRHERVGEAEKGWFKEYFSSEPQYSIDVRTTNSLVSPYTGVCEFKLVSHLTVLHSTKEEAEQDNNFIYTGTPVKHRHTYAFQDGRWVPILRQNYWAFEGEWINCDDCNINPNTGKRFCDEYGCWEPNAKHPVTSCNQ